LARLPDFVHLPDDGFDSAVVLLHCHLQRHVALHQDLVLFGCYPLPQVVEGTLHLLLVLAIGFRHVFYVLLELAFLASQPINVRVDALQKILQLALDDRLALL